MKRQEIADFIEGIRMQAGDRTFSEETLEQAAETMHTIFKNTETLDSDGVDAYLTTCLCVYILDSYEKDVDMITDIKPKGRIK